MKLAQLLWILPAAVVIQACSNGVSIENSMLRKGEIIPVKVITLAKQELQPEVVTAGTFTTDDETFLSFKTGGIIEKIQVKEGDAIKKGQLLAQLNLTEIEAQVAQAQLAHEKAERDFVRVKNLYQDSVATLEQFQNARTALEVATRQWEAARFNKSYSEIRALGDGFVLRKLANEGQIMAPGTPVFQTNGAARGQWILKTGVSDREWAMIKLGDVATVTSEATPGKVWAATVTRKSEGTDAYNGTFTLDLTLQPPVTGLAAGLFGKARIVTSARQQVWKIPYESLLDGDARTGYVFITDDGQNARKVPVVVYSIENDHVIIESGLEHARNLIVSGSAYLIDGSPIQVVQ